MSQRVPRRTKVAPSFGGAMLLFPALALLSVLLVWPLLEVTVLAVRSGQLGDVWSGAHLRDLGFTAAASIAAAIICVAISFILVTVFHASRGWPSALVTIVVLIPLLVPHLIGAYATRLLLAPSGPIIRLMFGTGGPNLLIGPTGLIVAMVWKYLPLAYLSIRAARTAVPPELIQAASDLGASRLTVARKVLIPLMSPGLLSGGIMVGLLSAAQFSITLVVYGGRTTTTIPIDVFLLRNMGRTDEAAALGIGFSVAVVAATLIGEALVRRRTAHVG